MVIKKLHKRDIEKVIEKGGDVAADRNNKEWINFTLRIRKDLLSKIDKKLEDRIGMSKTGWILEAIQKELK